MAHPLSRNDVRIGLIVLAVATVIAAIAMVVVLVLGTDRTVRPLGRVLSIAVVAPTEPDVHPGETMEVGALRDGFDRAVLERASSAALEEGYLPPDAYVGAPWDGPGVSRMPAPTPVKDDAPMQAYRRVVDGPVPQGPAADPLADGSHLFGFDKLPGDRSVEHRERSMPIQPIATPSASHESGGPVPYLSE